MTSQHAHHEDGCPPGLRLMAYACAQLHEAQRQLCQQGELLHDGIHQARKCMRRARSMLALGKRRLGDRARRLDGELGQLCRGLSPLRDAEALIEILQRLDSEADATLAGLLPEAEDSARRRRDRMLLRCLRHDPGFERRQQRLAALQGRLSRLDWHSVDPATIGKAMKRSERRATRAGEEARAQPGDDGPWHAYRRRLRRLRQQNSALVEAGLETLCRNPGLLDQATALGEAQDDVLLLRHSGPRSLFKPATRARLKIIAKARITAFRQGKDHGLDRDLDRIGAQGACD